MAERFTPATRNLTFQSAFSMPTHRTMVLQYEPKVPAFQMFQPSCQVSFVPILGPAQTGFSAIGTVQSQLQTPSAQTVEVTAIPMGFLILSRLLLAKNKTAMSMEFPIPAKPTATGMA